MSEPRPFQVPSLRPPPPAARRRCHPLAAFTAAALALAGASPAPAAADAEPAARRVAERVTEALGGEAAWDEVRLVHFGFAGRRTHHWDLTTGRHRVEGETRDGERYLVIEHLDDRTGRAWVDGVEVAGERAAELLETAYGAWVNDTYWLLMPYKLLDPGVHLTHERTEEVGGAVYDVLGLRFDAVGLTPGDRYWAWVNRDTGLMDRWAYRLQSQPEDAEPTVWLWQGWDWYGPEGARVRLAPRREMLDGGRTLLLDPIEISDAVPEALFTGP
jgi:hypothetical protein